MKKNMGSADRIIRVMIAVIAVVLYATNMITGVFGLILIALSGIFLLTSFISFCPIYAALGLRSTKKSTN